MIRHSCSVTKAIFLCSSLSLSGRLSSAVSRTVIAMCTLKDSDVDDMSVCHVLTRAIRLTSCDNCCTGPTTRSLYCEAGMTSSSQLQTTLKSAFRATHAAILGRSSVTCSKYISKASSVSVKVKPCGRVVSCLSFSSISSISSVRGKLIEDILLKHNLSLLNDGSYTYLHPATGSLSAIDLSIATPSLYLDFSWQVISDQHGSDHFPICIHSYTTAPPVTNGTWNGPPILQKLLQIWAKIILMIWKIPSSI